MILQRLAAVVPLSRASSPRPPIVMGSAMPVVLAVLVFTLLSPVSVLAQQPNAGGYQPNVYGPGINSDATGRPFRWQPSPGTGPADPLSNVRPNAYGPGIAMDQYGRPVRARP